MPTSKTKSERGKLPRVYILRGGNFVTPDRILPIQKRLSFGIEGKGGGGVRGKKKGCTHSRNPRSKKCRSKVEHNRHMASFQKRVKQRALQKISKRVHELKHQPKEPSYVPFPTY